MNKDSKGREGRRRRMRVGNKEKEDVGLLIKSYMEIWKVATGGTD
jgi:hypothetical protein